MGKRAENIRVVIRFRPINDIERKVSEEAGLNISITNKNRTVKLKHEMKEKSFNFDYIFDETTTQVPFFNICCKPVMDSVLKGFNGTIFAYGQTGSGKTWCMMGPTDERKGDENLRGIIPRASESIFEHINAASDQLEFKICLSYLEIYNDEIQDLLDTNNNKLKIHESPTKGIFVKDLTEVYITSLEEVYYYIKLGDHNKSMATTGMNKLSSRSHSVFSLTVYQTDKLTGSTIEGRVNLVDLAGSEKVRKTGAKGMRLKEAQNINKSLSALGHCINCIVEKKPHIPYRNSKLTRILQESLGGNSKTTVVCTVSPHCYNIEETLSTLGFGKRAKSIKLRVQANVRKSAEELQKLVESLERQLKREKLKNKKLLKELKQLRGLTPEEEKQLTRLEEIQEEETEGYHDEDEDIDSDSEEAKFSDMTRTELQFELKKLKLQHENDMVELKDENLKMQGEREDLLAEVEVNRKEMAKMEQEAKEVSEQKRIMEKMKDDMNKKIEFERKQLETEKNEFEKEILELNKKVEKLEGEKMKAEEELQGVQGGKLKDPKERAEFMSQLESFRRKNSDLQEENEMILENYVKMEEELEELKKKEVLLTSDLEVRTEKFNKAKSLCNTLEMKLREYDKDLNATENDLLQIIDEVEAKDATIADLRKNNKSLNEKVDIKNIALKKLVILLRNHGVNVSEIKDVKLSDLELPTSVIIESKGSSSSTAAVDPMKDERKRLSIQKLDDLDNRNGQLEELAVLYDKSAMRILGFDKLALQQDMAILDENKFTINDDDELVITSSGKVVGKINDEGEISSSEGKAVGMIAENGELCSYKNPNGVCYIKNNGTIAAEHETIQQSSQDKKNDKDSIIVEKSYNSLVTKVNPDLLEGNIDVVYQHPVSGSKTKSLPILCPSVSKKEELVSIDGDGCLVTSTGLIFASFGNEGIISEAGEKPKYTSSEVRPIVNVDGKAQQLLVVEGEDGKGDMLVLFDGKNKREVTISGSKGQVVYADTGEAISSISTRSHMIRTDEGKRIVEEINPIVVKGAEQQQDLSYAGIGTPSSSSGGAIASSSSSSGAAAAIVSGQKSNTTATTSIGGGFMEKKNKKSENFVSSEKIKKLERLASDRLSTIKNLKKELEEVSFSSEETEKKLRERIREKEKKINDLENVKIRNLVNETKIKDQRLKLFETKIRESSRLFKEYKSKTQEHIRSLESEKKEFLIEREKYVQKSVEEAKGSKFRGSRNSRFGGGIKELVNELFSLRLKYKKASQEREKLLKECNHQRRQMQVDRKKLRVSDTKLKNQEKRSTDLENELEFERNSTKNRRYEFGEWKKERVDLMNRVEELKTKLQQAREFEKEQKNLNTQWNSSPGRFHTPFQSRKISKPITIRGGGNQGSMLLKTALLNTKN